MKDPYEILGVARTASAAEIQKAYRKQAKKLHPDLNPGNAKAAENFSELNAANNLLSDPEKRKRFDAGEIDASGAEKPSQRYYRDYAGESAAGHAYDNRSGFQDFADNDDIFAQMFARQASQARRRRGADLHYKLAVEFLDAINGAKNRIQLPEGGTLDLTISAGTVEGQTLRLRGKGAPFTGPGRPRRRLCRNQHQTAQILQPAR